MANDYITLRQRIQDEVNNSAIATDARVNNAIQSAIAFYDRERWWFTESRDNTFSTVINQAYYSSADASWIPNINDFDELTITVSATRYQLVRRTWEWLDKRSVTDTSIGPPTDWTYYQKQIRLYPVPGAVYSIRFSGGLPTTALSADSDTNGWTTVGVAEDLIRARAKWDIFLNIAQDTDNAGTQKSIENEAYLSLTLANSRRLSSGKITPQRF